MKIFRTGRFEEMLVNLVKNDRELLNLVTYKIKLFYKNSSDTRLDTHALRKHMDGKWAFSIAGDIRIVFEWIGEHSVRFLRIGGHDVVYTRRRKKKRK